MLDSIASPAFIVMAQPDDTKSDAFISAIAASIEKHLDHKTEVVI